MICYAVIDTNVIVSALLSSKDAPSGFVLPDMKDLPFYEVVLEKRDDEAYLVTGNIKHFPHEPFIVTPRELLDLLDNYK
ncbi:MAG: hypothetical protein OSJ72_05555 [Lachnospiraceae bacterium]|nr:hypothetical protein [Lachnospiraceae bacterium]